MEPGYSFVEDSRFIPFSSRSNQLKLFECYIVTPETSKLISRYTREARQDRVYNNGSQLS